MSKQLHSHEGVYTRTCGTCGPTANVNVLAVAKEQMKQDKVNVSSSTKGDTEVLKQKQVNFLKKHESEITNYIKSNDPEVVRVKYDWDSVKVGDSGSFTESGFDIRLKVYGANDKELNGYSFFIVPKPNVENPISIDSISGSNFP